MKKLLKSMCIGLSAAALLTFVGCETVEVIEKGENADGCVHVYSDFDYDGTKVFVSCSSCGSRYAVTHTLGQDDCEVCSEMFTDHTSEGLAFEEVEGGYSVVGIGECRDVDIVVPAEHNGKPVVAVGAHAFVGEESAAVKVVLLPSSVTSVGNRAFSGCASLENIALSGVTSLGEGAFFGASKLERIEFPATLVDIPAFAFAECSALTGIKFGERIASVGDYAFADTALAEVVIPETVNKIGHHAFMNTNLKEIVIPASVASVGQTAFENCVQLEKAVFAEGGITAVEDHCFYGCVALKDVDFGGVESIGWEAFRGCSSLVNADLSSVGSIDEHAFAGCTSLESVILSKTLDNVGKAAFMSCSALKNVTIPDGVLSVGDFAFAECGALETVMLPASVTAIGNFAFSGCTSVTEIDLSGVTAIGYSALEGCSVLKELTLGGELSSVGFKALAGCTSLETVSFGGTVAEWQALGSDEWCQGASGFTVNCIDGVIA